MKTNQQKGFSLIEVLVTVVILSVGLLGLAGLQARALTSQMESYQRSQALILLKDMASRIDANRKNVATYVTGTAYLGTGDTQPTSCAGLPAGQTLDFCEWSNTLKGSAEALGANKVGAMIGARGCIFEIAPLSLGIPGQYVVVVSWQGINTTAAPDVSTATSPGLCGQTLYTNESMHRVISLPIDMAYLL